MKKEFAFDFIEYTELGDAIVRPACEGTFELETRRVPVRGTGIPGFPETCRMARRTQIARRFLPTALEVSPVCAPYFAIKQMFIGQNKQWDCAGPVPATIFASRPPIKFSVVELHLTATLQVVNISKESRLFSAKLVGIYVDARKKKAR